jgi:acyl dehydratase
MSEQLYLDDFTVGQRFKSSEPVVVDTGAIKSFARDFDPQPFHLEETAADASLFRGLAASGWHTSALTMGLVVRSDLRPAGGIVGVGVDDLRWPRPVRPGDRLSVEGEVLEVRPSRSKPGQGIVRVRFSTLNQRGEAVQEMVANLRVPRRSL